MKIAGEPFQYLGQPIQECPSWVQDSCVIRKDENGHFVLVHERRSGKQWVYQGEWLFKAFDEVDALWFDNASFMAATT